MSNYVDGFILPVPKDNLEAYQKMAELAGQVWKDHGALEYVECISDDIQPGKLTSFPQSVLLKDNESVIFAFAIYRDRQHRDEVNAKVMADPRLKDMKPETMPFDTKRMFWGGFKTIIKL